MEKTPEELYKEREKRINDAIQLKVPDKVPFFPLTHGYAAKYTGMTHKEAFYDTDRWIAANKTTNIELEPDLYFPSFSTVFVPGQAYEAVDFKQIKWPGHGVPDNHTFQFVEGEYMKADEYDAFIDDPSDFAIRTYMPRIYGTLEAFKTLPPLKAMLYGYLAPRVTPLFITPEVLAALESLFKCAAASAQYVGADIAFDQEMKALGFPPFVPCTTPAIIVPFDFISDLLRGMRGTMLDMYQRPDKLLAAMEKLYPMLLGMALGAVQMSGNPRVFIPLHRGADGFMSPEQFETFYWPMLQRIINDLVANGATPCIYWEGYYDTRLEYLAKLPKGKILGMFQRTDLFKAKEILGDTMCIAGDMPLSLLQTGTPEQVRAYAKKLIDVVGKDGGFIMSSGGVMDEAEPELVKVWKDFTNDYGVYR